MGPSTLIDGDGRRWRSTAPRWPRFNGAVDSHRRRRPFVVACEEIVWLQWGRRLSSTETIERIYGARTTSDASMGPSTLIDGDRRRLRSAAAPLPASMGPSTLIDGDGDDTRAAAAIA